VQVSSVAVALITFSTFPVFVALLEPLLSGEKLRAADVALAALALAGPRTAQAQGYPVVDNYNIAEAIAIATNTAEQVSRLSQLYDTVLGVKDAIGGRGSQQGVAGLLTLSQALAGTAPRLPFPPDGKAFPANAPRTVAALREFASSAFYSTNRSDAGREASFQQSRQQAAREAALNGYAVALQARDDAANMPQRVTALAKSAEGAQDLRQDILAGNTALLAMLERLNQMQAVMASLLEIEASQRLAADPSYVLPR
jgi:hypothetical protein